MLFAEHAGLALAFACSVPWKKMSAGFAGTSDGWQDLSQNFQLVHEYPRAENGNVALTGEIDLEASGEEFVLALGAGACLFLGSREEMLPGAALTAFLQKHSITVMTTTPSALSSLSPGDLPSLRILIVAGEGPWHRNDLGGDPLAVHVLKRGLRRPRHRDLVAAGDLESAVRHHLRACLVGHAVSVDVDSAGGHLVLPRSAIQIDNLFVVTFMLG